MTMTVPDRAEVVITSTAKVSSLAEIRLSSRAKRAHRIPKRLSRIIKKRDR